MIGLLLTLALVGLCVWIIVTYVPMPPPFRSALIAIAAVILILYLIRVLGIGDIPVPRVR